MTIANEHVQGALLGDAVDHAPVGIFVADDQMQYIAVNRYACELLGYTREELLAIRVSDVARSTEAPAEFEAMMIGRRNEGRARLTRKDGSEIDVAFRASETRVGGLDYYVSVVWPETPA